MPKRDKNIKVVTLKSGEKRYKFNTYVGSVAVPGTRKKQRVFKSGTFKTYNEAKVAYDKVRADGVGHNYAASKQKTVDEVYQEWVKYYEKSVTGGTYHVTTRNYELHIKPALGDMYIDQIESSAFQQWVNELADSIVNYKAIIAVFNRIYKYGIIKKYCLPQDNPMFYALIPKKGKKGKDTKDNFYTLSELKEFLEAAKSYSYRSYVYFYLIATTGMRKGEANALTWSDVDFENQTISITKTRTIDKNNKQITKNGTKTPNSTRKVVISTSVTKELKKYKAITQTDKTDLVFHIRYHALSKGYPSDWLKVIYRNNPTLKVITPHGFRHTFATIMRNSSNVKDLDVQFSMGHDSISMTNHYTHKTAEESQRILEALKKMDL
ncbi:integrase [Lactobacillus colini]|uniref:Integrase n=1 Tax=Lactobacillus colini TaxID=1819254 RepID=A0ABS4MH26_9LACO|nr:site-specific integrase [Lactobacillus colini]MBP2058639.1 integrase [Lactobacillus colini]